MKQEKSNVVAFHGGKASPQNADEQITLKTGVPPVKMGFMECWKAGAAQAQGNPPAAPPATPAQGAASPAPATNTQKRGGGNGGGGNNNVPPAQPGKPVRGVGEKLQMIFGITGILAAVGLMYSSHLDDKKHERETALQIEAIRNNVKTLPAIPSSSTGSMTYAQISAMPAAPAQPASSNSLPDCLVVGKIGSGESCTLKEIRTDVNVDYPTTWIASSGCVEQKSFEIVDDATDSAIRPVINAHGNRSLRTCNHYTYSVTRGALYFIKR